MKYRSISALIAAAALLGFGISHTVHKAPAAKPWTKLENCRLIPNASNDGDSFHVRHQGKEYLFRLYFVDTAETSSDAQVEARIGEQATYFGITRGEALQLGKEATMFTSRQLAGNFTVWTRYRNALGRSKLPRYYAVIQIGRADLAQLLVKNGLARIYGARTVLPDGIDSRSYLKILATLEQEAKKAHVGAWKSSAVAGVR